MEVASEMTEYKHESSMEITDNTRSVVGCCMGMLYESMYDEQRRNAMLEEIDKFVKLV
jgi:protein unc-45